MSTLGFQMWEPFRQNMMAEHRFYVEQARKRLLSQFDNLEGEADKAADEYLERGSVNFNPDAHDPSDFYEAAYDKGIEFYQLLSDMRENTRLSVVAGMYHQWDKKLREWIAQEVRHWHHGDNANRSIWKAEFPAIADFLVAIGFDIRRLACYEQLNAMRLVVNVFKHGDGPSFDELKAIHPEFLLNPMGGDEQLLPLGFLEYTDLKVSDVHFDQFSDAILKFWQAIPKEIYIEEELDFPGWFEKAVLKDRKTDDPNS